MNLGEMKKKVLSLIEEIDTTKTSLTNDPDIEAKLPHVINQIQNELARMKKINARTSKGVEEGEVLDLTTLDKFYQLNVIISSVDYNSVEQFITFLDDGVADIYYYKYPTTIDENTEDSFEFELSQDALEILPYGVAADLLKSDVSNGYGQIYAQRYREMLQTLDPRYNLGSITISEGIDI
jgi:hypothetical protein